MLISFQCELSKGKLLTKADVQLSATYENSEVLFLREMCKNAQWLSELAISCMRRDCQLGSSGGSCEDRQNESAYCGTASPKTHCYLYFFTGRDTSKEMSKAAERHHAEGYGGCR